MANASANASAVAPAVGVDALPNAKAPQASEAASAVVVGRLIGKNPRASATPRPATTAATATANGEATSAASATTKPAEAKPTSEPVSPNGAPILR
jgi:hypothetical protein